MSAQRWALSPGLRDRLEHACAGRDAPEANKRTLILEIRAQEDLLEKKLRGQIRSLGHGKMEGEASRMVASTRSSVL